MRNLKNTERVIIYGTPVMPDVFIRVNMKNMRKTKTEKKENYLTKIFFGH